MKQFLILVLCTFSVFTNCASEDKNNSRPGSISNNTKKPTGSKMKVKIGDHVFIATLYDNATSTAFKALLPLTIKMIELNGNEKYYDLPKILPTSSFRPAKIQSGDLMIYGSRTLVLFYETFTTSYSYTKLGQIDDASGLAAALGKENITVTFEE